MSLKQILTRQIETSGPLCLADYMAACLMHPEHGYYATRDPFGAAGDFTTAPEISQMFGELVGLCLAQAWLDQGAPARFTLAELGPGRGTLMADILRATRAVPGFHAAAQITLIETSATLRALQSETLQAYQPRWLDQAADLPEAPLFAVANEFFDALPIRQFRRAEAGWEECVVGLEAGRLKPGFAPAADLPVLEPRLQDTQPGDLVETCAPASAITAEISARIASHGGAGLIFDYGDWHSLGDTLQALQKHQPVDPFSTPGEADLTAHVDFEALAAAVAPAKHTRLTPQGVFLERLGITARAQALAQHLSGAALEAHIAAHRRLTHPSEMGSLFKVLGIYPAQANPPPGLEP